ncbi:hypothetical protein D922_01534 [Enterococcus faecalis 06-MB-DW-09]|nr:hypothetical protein D922_01534 [Enterococcus faecalis 06-MB-DW-09]
MTINISLTQFLTYSSKVSTSAKIKAVRDMKHSADYHPALDYWKPLRDEIKRLHENNLPIENLSNLLLTIDEKKTKNYTNAINTYIRFVNKNDVSYFKVGKSFWKLSDELFVGSSPELGLIVNGKKFYVKNYYKKKSTDAKVTKRNIQSTLTLMQLADRDFQMEPDSNFAVLNLQNGKIIEAGPLKSEDVLELEVDAQNFVNTWERI